MANLITLTRFLLLFLLVAMVLAAGPVWQLANAPLMILIIALDGLDGWVARRRGETSRFGSMFDIAVDRVVENVAWIVLAYVDLVPVWIAIAFITRGVIVDTIRFVSVSEGESVFGMMRSRLGRALVAGRFMRGLYGAAKAVAFAWLLMIQPWPALMPQLWAEWGGWLLGVGHGLVGLALLLCLVRGVPVVAEFLWAEGVVAKPKALREAP